MKDHVDAGTAAATVARSRMSPSISFTLPDAMAAARSANRPRLMLSRTTTSVVFAASS